MGEVFPYVAANNEFDETGFVPSVPITLLHNGRNIRVNVLPHSIGLALGGIWDNNKASLRLAGNPGHFRAQGLLVQAMVGDYLPVDLAFAWTELNTVPLLLGQVNFLMAFDVCFFGLV